MINRCERCHGLMVPDHPARFCADHNSVVIEDEALDAWKCVNCANILDSVIAANRVGHGIETELDRMKARYE